MRHLHEFARVVRELRPRWIAAENVSDDVVESIENAIKIAVLLLMAFVDGYLGYTLLLCQCHAA